MKRLIFILGTIFLLGLSLIFWSCAGATGDDDDDDECVAEDVNANFLVVLTVTADSCSDGNVGDTTRGTLHIEQGVDDNENPKKDVVAYLIVEGTGKEAFRFNGTACGYQIIGNVIDETELGNHDCLETEQTAYNLLVNAESTTPTISGSVNTTTSYSGTDCPPPIEPGDSCAIEEDLETI